MNDDRFVNRRMTRRTRTFSDVSDADVVNQIATDPRWPICAASSSITTDPVFTSSTP